MNFFVGAVDKKHYMGAAPPITTQGWRYFATAFPLPEIRKGSLSEYSLRWLASTEAQRMYEYVSIGAQADAQNVPDSEATLSI